MSVRTRFGVMIQELKNWIHVRSGPLESRWPVVEDASQEKGSTADSGQFDVLIPTAALALRRTAFES